MREYRESEGDNAPTLPPPKVSGFQELDFDPIRMAEHHRNFENQFKKERRKAWWNRKLFGAITWGGAALIIALGFIAGYLARGVDPGLLIPSARAQADQRLPGVPVGRPVMQTPDGSCVVYFRMENPHGVYLTQCLRGGHQQTALAVSR